MTKSKNPQKNTRWPIRFFRHAGKRLAYVFFLLVIVTSLLELAYRIQVVDFYRAPLQALNPTSVINPASPVDTTVLLIGDSFTAQPDGYVSHLRNVRPQWRFINAAIPGTGMRQHELILQKRVKRFKPDILIYQFYVGNDLSDIIHPWNGDSLSIFRNVYWWLSDRLLVLPYINQQLSFLKYGKHDTAAGPDFPLIFDPKTYTPRVKMYLKADPYTIQHSVMLDQAKEKHYQIWQKKMQGILEKLPENMKFYFLFVPHCTQVSAKYQENYQQLGAAISDNMLTVHYPLIARVKKDFPQIQVLNPLSAFQAAPHADSLYFQHDPHFTAYGQEVLGRYVQTSIFY